jgi:endo-1,4-beta-xylanase
MPWPNREAAIHTGYKRGGAVALDSIPISLAFYFINMSSRSARRKAPAQNAVALTLAKKLPAIALYALLTTGAMSQPKPTDPALKDVFKKDFLIGAALNQHQFTTTDTNDCEVALIRRQFNSITPENILKWEAVHPWPGRYNFGPSDHYVDFGVKNKMFIIGHNLVWHNQTPDWVFHNEFGATLSRDALLARMRDHIFTVMGRYKGKIRGWDVVNEAVDEDGSLRKSSWLKIIGEDYLLKAYQYAHEADPKAELYYNEYSMENPAKRNGVIALIQKLRAQGAHITGVGIQGHYNLNWPAPSQVEDTINAFSALGLKVMITELDVDVLPPVNRSHSAEVSLKVQGRQSDNPYPDGLPDAMQEKLAARYRDLFQVFVKHRRQLSRVTFWGVTDADTWLNVWPVAGRVNYPLLFDRNCAPKPAFDAVTRVAR